MTLTLVLGCASAKAATARRGPGVDDSLIYVTGALVGTTLTGCRRACLCEPVSGACVIVTLPTKLMPSCSQATTGTYLSVPQSLRQRMQGGWPPNGPARTTIAAISAGANVKVRLSGHLGHDLGPPWPAQRPQRRGRFAYYRAASLLVVTTIGLEGCISAASCFRGDTALSWLKPRTHNPLVASSPPAADIDALRNPVMLSRSIGSLSCTVVGATPTSPQPYRGHFGQPCCRRYGVGRRELHYGGPHTGNHQRALPVPSHNVNARPPRGPAASARGRSAHGHKCTTLSPGRPPAHPLARRKYLSLLDLI